MTCGVKKLLIGYKINVDKRRKILIMEKKGKYEIILATTEKC